MSDIEEELDISSWFEAMRPPLLVPPSEWCALHRVMLASSSARPGLWRAETTPYAAEPLDAFADPAVEKVTLAFASQTGKTTIIENAIAWMIAVDPGPSMFVWPDLQLAEGMSRERLDPMFEACEPLRERIAARRERDSSNTILSKTYPGGSLVLCGSNSPSSLASRPIRYLFADEIDRFSDSAGGGTSGEGDPLALAIRRTVSFHSRKIVQTSTPTNENSRIWQELERSDWRVWMCACPHCQHEQPLIWKQVRWTDKDPESAYYECVQCGAALSEAERISMMQSGYWVPTKPDTAEKGHVGYHLTAVASPFVSMAELVREWLKAEGKPALKRVFVNTLEARPYDAIAEDSGLDVQFLLSRAEDKDWRQIMPERAVCVTAGVDIQQDRIEVGYWAWAEGFEGWCLDHTVILGDTTTPGPFEQLEQALLRTWRHPAGIDIPVSCALVDSGFRTEAVYKFSQANLPKGRLWYASKGKAGEGLRLVQMSKEAVITGVKPFWVAVDEGKNLIHGGLQQDKAGPGFIHTSIALGVEYHEQLLSERRIVEFNRWGKGRVVWKRDTRVRNEALDTSVYALAAAHAYGPQWAALKPQPPAVPLRPVQAPAYQPPPPQAPQPTSKPQQPPDVAALARRFQGSFNRGHHGIR